MCQNCAVLERVKEEGVVYQEERMMQIIVSGKAFADYPILEEKWIYGRVHREKDIVGKFNLVGLMAKLTSEEIKLTERYAAFYEQNNPVSTLFDMMMLDKGGKELYLKTEM